MVAELLKAESALQRWHRQLVEMSHPAFELTAEEFAPLLATYHELRHTGHQFDAGTVTLMTVLERQQHDGEEDGDSDVDYADFENDDPDEDRGAPESIGDGYASLERAKAFAMGAASARRRQPVAPDVNDDTRIGAGHAGPPINIAAIAPRSIEANRLAVNGDLTHADAEGHDWRELLPAVKEYKNRAIAIDGGEFGPEFTDDETGGDDDQREGGDYDGPGGNLL